MNLLIEIRDADTRDYWTRVNYETVVPPGRSTLIIPVKQLFVGEKSRPGRSLKLDKITRLVFSIGDKPARALLLDDVHWSAARDRRGRASRACMPSTSDQTPAP